LNVHEAEFLLEIAQTQNMTKAASNLYVSQPALSKVVKKLTQEFGTELFYKQGRYLLPTEIGKTVINYAKVIVQANQQMEAEIQAKKNHGNKGILRFGVPTTGDFFYTPVMVAFSKKYPDIHVQVSQMGGIQMAQAVADGTLDLGFSFLSQKYEELNECPIYRSELALGVSPDHPLAKKDTVFLNDLHHQPYISFDKHTSVHNLLTSKFEEYHISPVPVIQGTDAAYMIRYAKDAGISCIFPKPVLEYFEWPEHLIKSFSPPLPWSLELFYHKSTAKINPIMTSISFALDFLHSDEFKVDVPCVDHNHSMNVAKYVV
jgi:DNA-binding transcriptional LysR family regulator